ncbi:uncharacterized protein LOC111897467 [Lactuca sativa]|uniref:uncharacterized protein LOC111897467 n=1 Tax=Lactuca sativa TaxID=4236 RepID=UPI000CD93638|nr:uncharacterized protein LOC111897467 [Lactuca sativa]
MVAPGDDSQPNENPKQFFHPAFAVTNIKNAIPIILDQSDDRFASWVEFFSIVACANDILDHISTEAPQSPSVDDTTWNRLDTLIKLWIYSTITLEVLKVIMLPGATTQQLWDRLQEIFQDNRATRTLSDQLANVDNPVSEMKMMLQLVSGLTRGEFDTIAALIQ